jgi:hypothetical protein
MQLFDDSLIEQAHGRSLHVSSSDVNIDETNLFRR